jgi:hypothetical protein
MRNMVHQVDVMEPATATDDYNQPSGQPTVYIPKVPCSIEPLNSSEVTLARQINATHLYKVRFYGDPKKPIKHTQHLRQKTAVNPDKYRRLEIGSAIDLDQNGLKWELIVGEVVE